MSATTAPRYQSLPIVLLLGLFLALFGIFGGATVSHAAQANPTDTILVQFTTGASDQAIAALNRSHTVTQVDAIPALGIRVLRVPAGTRAATVAAAYAKNSLVQFAEVNALVRPEAIPNDPNYSTQWHLAKIQAPVAWDSAKATGVLVTVCDTGVEGTHPDLQPILRADLGWNAVDGSKDWSPIASHGTLVSGVIAAATNNGAGVAGVAWGANIIPVRISNFTDGSAYVSDAAKCIQYGADHGAKAINVSYRMAGSAALDTAGAYAQGRGAVTFVAAGNDGIDPGWPNYAGFVAVAATEIADNRAAYSNYGALVDIAAPGTGIKTTWPGARYDYASGTSLASPVAAGVMALVFGANPGLTPSQAQAILLNNADDLGGAGWDSSFGYGRVNASKAVGAALGGAALTDTTPPATSISAPASSSVVTGTVTATAVASDNVGVTKVEFYVDGALKGTATASPYSTSWNTTVVADGSHSLTAKAYDAAGNSASSALVTVSVQNLAVDSTPPTVSITAPASGATVSGAVSVIVSASDNVGVTKTELYVDGSLKATATASPFSISWDTRTTTDGDHSLAVKAYDAAGNATLSTALIVTAENAGALVTETFTGSVGTTKNRVASSSYAVNVAVGGQLTGTLSWGGKAKLDVAIYTPAGQLVATGAVSGAKLESFSFPATPGSYVLVVKAVSGSASYTLTVTHP
ncbi:MAG: peptidase S8 [Anaerolinea sp.]|nr:peptidase S8 [Anaerolinea sp.]